MNNRQIKRQIRIRKHIKSVSALSRLSVYRSNKYLYAQIIDDKAGKTILGISEKQQAGLNGTRIERARQIGIKIAELAKKKKIGKIVFDKGKYAYHGRVKALADGAREGGLVF
jgi:large subunit ribosomal protein L18